MKFHVEWFERAANDLATLWLEASPNLRQAITEATNRLDSMLASDPYGVGESRGNDKRICFEPPLCVGVRIDRAKQTVYVIRARLYGRPRP